MKKLFVVFTVIICLFNSSIFIQAQNDDRVSGSEPIVVPENIKSLLQQIKIAEDNEDWEEYARLREEIIQVWQKVNPKVARLYSNSNSGKPDLSADGAPVNNEKRFFNDIPEIEFEEPLESPDWDNDVLITSGKAYDISMDISADGDIYIAVSGRKDGTSIKDSVYIYKSTDGGSTWSEWSFIWTSTLEFDQVELMCFDHPSGTEAYILLFYLFDNGWLRVGRSDMNTPGWTYYDIVSANVLDFAVDRNYSQSNYRAICVYDSSNRIYSTRSEPSSYGTVWQDKVHINNLLGRDLDFAYGWNGAVYTTFNGNVSGNLYVIENTNYADPTSWDPQYTVATGNVDTTRHAEIIASREDYPDNQVIVLFEKKSSPTINTYDLFDATRDNNVWVAYSNWVVPDENKWPSMSIGYTATQNFRAAFVQSDELNMPPRRIKYKTFDGSNWSGSLQFSDGDVTGLQKPEVRDIDGDTPVSAFVGANYLGVYFDNEDWISDVQPLDNKIPDTYSLYQNYPNPFNPSTNIRYSVPELSFVNIKVFSLIGEEIAELVNEELQSGNYEVNFSATNLPSGIYFYRLQTGSFVVTKKMILMK